MYYSDFRGLKKLAIRTGAVGGGLIALTVAGGVEVLTFGHVRKTVVAAGIVAGTIYWLRRWRNTPAPIGNAPQRHLLDYESTTLPRPGAA